MKLGTKRKNALLALLIVVIGISVFSSSGPSSGFVNIGVGGLLIGVTGVAIGRRPDLDRMIRAGLWMMLLGGLFWCSEGVMILHILRGDAYFSETAGNLLTLVGLVLAMVGQGG